MKKLLTLGLAVPLSLLVASSASANEEVSTSEEAKETYQFELEGPTNKVQFKVEEHENEAKITITESNGNETEAIFDKKTEEIKYNGEEFNFDSLVLDADGEISYNNITVGEPGNTGKLIDSNTGSIGVANLESAAILAQLIAGVLDNKWATSAATIVNTLVSKYKHLNLVYYSELVWEIPDPSFNWLKAKQYEVFFYGDKYHTKFLFRGSFIM